MSFYLRIFFIWHIHVFFLLLFINIMFFNANTTRKLVNVDEIICWHLESLIKYLIVKISFYRSFFVGQSGSIQKCRRNKRQWKEYPVSICNFFFLKSHNQHKKKILHLFHRLTSHNQHKRKSTQKNNMHTYKTCNKANSWVDSIFCTKF